jgi:NAD(P)-dependent dehydrogenase (short-subunit alcohol dehydrogenase family)
MYADAISRGGLAVVTGAASGVGKVAAVRFAEAGLGVILADRDAAALATAEADVRAVASREVEVRSVPTDVSDFDSVAKLADTAFAMGEVAVLMNNAGIARPTKSWDNLDHWREIMNVNLFGVVHGIQAFVPRMIEAGRPAAVINTGSKQGITTPPGNPAYNVSKAGVKVTTEMLAYELRQAGAPVSAHLFVPGFTYTGMIARFMPEKPDAAWTSEQTVDHLLARLQQGDFYILCPDNDVTPARDRARVAWASGDITENRPALSRWHADHAEAFAAFEKQSI